MKKFLIQTSLFSFLCLASFLYILSRADGNTDPFYLRFTTPPQENLILGTSRAAQGLQPTIFKQELGVQFLNYAFTIAHSPYGKTYYESIKNKLDPTTKKGVFIITVDPWSICSKCDNPNDENSFRELKLCLANTPFVNMNPNYWYLIKNMGGKYYELLFPKKSNLYLHKDGWLEVTVDMSKKQIEKRTTTKLKDYRFKNLPKYKYSSVRFNYLKKTIELLKEHGEVYLVRMPIHPELMKIDNELMPNFNDKINELQPLVNGYLDMTPMNTEFIYVDGNHLYKTSGKLVSKYISKWIRDKKKK